MSTTSKEIETRMLHGIDSMEDDAHSAIEHGAEHARSMTRSSADWADRHETDTRHALRQIRDDAKKHTAQLTRAARQAIDTTRTQVKIAAKKTDTYVKANPWKTIAMTSALALAAGALLGRRSGR